MPVPEDQLEHEFAKEVAIENKEEKEDLALNLFLFVQCQVYPPQVGADPFGSPVYILPVVIYNRY
ncbi:MAG: hypothetical protein V3R54_04755 [Thermodesulfovibrionia bacterium]